MLVVHVVILGNLGQFNHCTNSKWQIDNQNVIFGFIQTRGTIHEYSLSFEEAFKDLATFKIIFRYKKHQKAFWTISIYFRPSRIEVYLEVRKNEIHIIFDEFNSDYICKIFL